MEQPKKYYGYYYEADLPHPMHFATFEIKKHSCDTYIIIGSGIDESGKFKIKGDFYDETNTNFEFKKIYKNDFSITFKGTYKKENDILSGIWEIGGIEGQEFEISRQLQIFNYKGWYQQNEYKTDYVFVLKQSPNSDEVTGGGRDNVGKFLWTGKLDKNTKQVVLKKQYKDDLNETIDLHAVDYQGTMEGKIISGIWSIEQLCSGKFEFTDIQDQYQLEDYVDDESDFSESETDDDQ